MVQPGLPAKKLEGRALHGTKEREKRLHLGADRYPHKRQIERMTVSRRLFYTLKAKPKPGKIKNQHAIKAQTDPPTTLTTQIKGIENQEQPVEKQEEKEVEFDDDVDFESEAVNVEILARPEYQDLLTMHELLP